MDGQPNLDTLNSNSKQDDQEPDTANNSHDADIIDIRQHEQNKSLAELLKSSLTGGMGSENNACFPNLLL